MKNLSVCTIQAGPGHARCMSAVPFDIEALLISIEKEGHARCMSAVPFDIETILASIDKDASNNVAMKAISTSLH